MGSFNVTCRLTNVAISGGNRAGFMILRPTPRRRSNGSPTTLITYGTDLYQPTLPAVFGEYDSYGRLEKITPSQTTRFIEARYKRPVEAVLECVSNQGRDIYSSAGPIFKHYALKEMHNIKWDATTEEYLTALGFEKTVKNGDTDVYSFKGASLNFTPFGVGIVDKEGKIVATAMTASASVKEHLVEAFAQATGIYPGFDEEAYGIIKDLAGLSGMFFLEEAFNVLRPHAEPDFWFGEKSYDQEFRDDWDEYKKSFKPKFVPEQVEGFTHNVGGRLDSVNEETGLRAYPAGWGLRMNEFFARSTGATIEDQELFYLYDDVEDFRQMRDMIGLVDELNIVFAPTRYSSEDSDGKAVRAAAEFTTELLGRRQAAWDAEAAEWDDEEDDEEDGDA